MGSQYDGDADSFPEDFTIPDAGDPDDAVTFDVPFSALGDRTRYLHKRALVVKRQLFTEAGSITFPAEYVEGSAYAIGVGGGGGGGGGSQGDQTGTLFLANGGGGGAGGGGAQAARIDIDPTPETEYDVLPGAGGAGGAAPDPYSHSGTDGNDSVIVGLPGGDAVWYGAQGGEGGGERSGDPLSWSAGGLPRKGPARAGTHGVARYPGCGGSGFRYPADDPFAGTAEETAGVGTAVAADRAGAAAGQSLTDDLGDGEPWGGGGPGGAGGSSSWPGGQGGKPGPGGDAFDDGPVAHAFPGGVGIPPGATDGPGIGAGGGGGGGGATSIDGGATGGAGAAGGNGAILICWLETVGS